MELNARAGDGTIVLKMNYVTVRTFKMKFTLAVIVLVAASGCAHNDTDTYLSRFIADLWVEGTDIVRIIWRDCSKKMVAAKDVIDQKDYYPKFVRCIKRKTLRGLDRSLSPDVVPIADGVNLVRFELVDQSGNVLQENDTSTWSEKELEEGEWKNLVLQRMAKVLRTHVIKFDFDDDKIVDKVEYRSRRRHHMMTMMMFGIVSIGMVFIPMGFQFLAVLGGKALLLAKMALILASIQGLKKIATSPLSYGFYHTYPPYEHYDKRSQDNWHNIVETRQDLGSNRVIKDIINVKNERLNMEDVVNNENVDKNKIKRVPKESILYPVRSSVIDLSSQFNLASTNKPFNQELIDLTSRPGEVQADYSLDLPYNGFHFQSPTSVISA
ncbi:unnamed protein product, partial [Brenthis ino]